MKSPKVFQLLQFLSREEQAAFRNYHLACSQRANKSTIKLLEVLLRCTHAGGQNWDKHDLFKKAFPQRSFTDNFLRKVSSILFADLRDFLVLEGLKAGGPAYDELFLKKLAERGAEHLFQLSLQQATQRLDKRVEQDTPTIFHHYLLAEAADQYFGRQQTRRSDPALQEKSDLLDAYFIAQKLKIGCEMANRNQIVDASYEPHLLPEVLEELTKRPALLQFPPVALYRQVLYTLTERTNEQHYEHLLQLLQLHQHRFSPAEAADLYRYAQNYCIRKINTGDRSYLEKLFHLYQQQLENGTNMPDGILPTSDYKNIVTLGLQLGQNDWVEQFLHTHKAYLVEDQRENVFNYTLASFYYSTKAYDQATELLNTVHFSDPYYEVNGKIMLLKIYLAEENFFSFYYLLDAFKIKLQRNQKVAASYRQSIVNFLTQCRALAQLQEHHRIWSVERFTRKKERLREKLEHQKNIFDRRWLMARLARL